MALPYAEVIGDPVAHSRSPLIHKYWLSRAGVLADYRATRVERGALPGFLAERQSDPDWRGCNVTIPHKESALGYLDRLDPTAAAIGAANCIVGGSTGLTGYNTDVDGVAATLRDIDLAGKEVAVIGGGGAARAALAYLARRDVAKVTVLVRDPGKAEPLRALATMDIAAMEDAAGVFPGASLVINASPLGMAGCPEMPRDLLAAIARTEATLFDMVYDPLVTAFLWAGKGERIDGLTMLVGQAARSFELFFRVSAPAPDRGLIELLTSRA